MEIHRLEEILDQSDLKDKSQGVRHDKRRYFHERK